MDMGITMLASAKTTTSAKSALGKLTETSNKTKK